MRFEFSIQVGGDDITGSQTLTRFTPHVPGSPRVNPSVCVTVGAHTSPPTFHPCRPRHHYARSSDGRAPPAFRLAANATPLMDTAPTSTSRLVTSSPRRSGLRPLHVWVCQDRSYGFRVSFFFSPFPPGRSARRNPGRTYGTLGCTGLWAWRLYCFTTSLIRGMLQLPHSSTFLTL